jgi:hypothetical protein
MTKTKKIVRGLVAVFIVALVLLTLGCASRPKALARNLELVPGGSEAVVTLVRITDDIMNTPIGDPKTYDVYLDGAVVEKIGKNERLKFLVPNGSHTIFVQPNDNARGRPPSGELRFTANSDEILFHLYHDGSTHQLLNLERMN